MTSLTGGGDPDDVGDGHEDGGAVDSDSDLRPDRSTAPRGPDTPRDRAARPTLGVRLAQADADERRRAARALLRRPMLTAEGPLGDVLVLVRRHREALAVWFMEQLGWRLVVENDFARLHKLPSPGGSRGRGLVTRSDVAFDPRHYALFCLVLAALDQTGDQTALTRLAEEVRLRAAEIPGLGADFDRVADRWAFVHAARACVDAGAMQLRDGDDERFARGEEGGDALYRVHHRRVAQLLSCPVPPSLAADPDGIGVEQVADTADGRARRARHRIQRRLVDEAVLHADDLEPSEREYLGNQGARIARRIEDAFDFTVEQRREGLAAVDPSGESSDLAFPSEGTVGHAALLVAADLAERARRGVPDVADADVAALIDGLAVIHARYWRSDLSESPAARERLGDEVLARLEAFGLVRRRDGRVAVRPAAARFAVAPPVLPSPDSESGSAPDLPPFGASAPGSPPGAPGEAPR